MSMARLTWSKAAQGTRETRSTFRSSSAYGTLALICGSVYAEARVGLFPLSAICTMLRLVDIVRTKSHVSAFCGAFLGMTNDQNSVLVGANSSLPPISCDAGSSAYANWPATFEFFGSLNVLW